MKRFLYGFLMALIGLMAFLFVQHINKSKVPKEPLQFFSQDQYIDDKEPHRSYIVVVSPPKTNEDLRLVVDDYIEKNYDFNVIDGLGRYSMYFYKESKTTKRVYQERPKYTDYLKGGSYVPRIDPDDMLLMIMWEKTNVYRISYRFRHTGDTCPIYLAVYENGVEQKMYSDEYPCEDPNNPGTYFPGGWVTTKKSGARFVPSVK